jgi:hypothetical protein
MRVDAEFHAFLLVDAPAELLQCLGHVLQILFGCSLGPAGSRIGLLVIASELPAEADYPEMIFDDGLTACGIFEVSIASPRSARDCDDADSDIIEPLLQLGCFAGVVLA